MCDLSRAKRQIQALAKKLDANLAESYVNSAFDRFPPNWCYANFGVVYPPATLVFSSSSYTNFMMGDQKEWKEDEGE